MYHIFIHSSASGLLVYFYVLAIINSASMNSGIKRQSSEWEKIIANKTTDKGLISKISKRLVQLNTRKTLLMIFKLFAIDLPLGKNQES